MRLTPLALPPLRPPVHSSRLANEADQASPAGGAGAGAASSAPRAEHPLSNANIMKHLTPFVNASDYLFVAGVSRCWSNAWRRLQRPKETSGISATTTPSQLRHSFSCGLERNSSVCLAAARLRRSDLLKVARAAGCPWDVTVAIELARSGCAEMLKWARSSEDPCPWSEEVCDLAAEGGNMSLVRWLRMKGCPCSPRTMAGIAATGGLKRNLGPEALVQWAWSTGVPWDGSTSNNLARRGELDTLKWAVGEGCLTSAETTAAAAGCGRLDVLMWLRSQDCDWGPDTCWEVCTCMPVVV